MTNMNIGRESIECICRYKYLGVKFLAGRTCYKYLGVKLLACRTCISPMHVQKGISEVTAIWR